MPNLLVDQCLDILKREDVKKELKLLLKPIFEFLLFEIQPYTYITVFLLFMLFAMTLANLLLFLYVLRSKTETVATL
jgi:hypothetical protein